jgi:hypothetical protein
MKLSKVGFSNSTIISTSLLSFSSPRAKEPNRPILLTPNLFFISCSCRLKISIIFIIASCKYGRQRLKTCLFRPRKISAQHIFPRVRRGISLWVLGFSSKTLCLRPLAPSSARAHMRAHGRGQTHACGRLRGPAATQPEAAQGNALRDMGAELAPGPTTRQRGLTDIIKKHAITFVPRTSQKDLYSRVFFYSYETMHQPG